MKNNAMDNVAGVNGEAEYSTMSYNDSPKNSDTDRILLQSSPALSAPRSRSFRFSTIAFNNHYLRVPYLILSAVEALILIGAVYLGTYLAVITDGGNIAYKLRIQLGALLPKALLFMAIMLLSMGAMGLYRAHRREGGAGLLLRLLAALAFGGGLLAASFYFLPALFLGRAAFIVSAFIAFLFLLAVRLWFAHTIDKNAMRRRILVYGAGDTAQLINALRRTADQRYFKVLGYIPLADEVSRVEASTLLHLSGSLVETARAHRADEIVIAVNDRRNHLPHEDLLNCRLDGMQVLDCATFLERETGKVNLACLRGESMIYNRGFKNNPLFAGVSRVMDISVSLILLLVTLPLMALAALLVWLQDGGKHPVLYRQTRVGLNGKPFTLYKFRSMRVNAEQGEKAVWAKVNDDRITPVGRWLRKCRLDELPQVFNVLTGHMSLVGPRPERPEFVAELTHSIPFYCLRHRVRPGITGWAQLNYPYGASEQDAYEKLQYDLYYIKNRSLFLDMTILIQTVEVVLWGQGAR